MGLRDFLAKRISRRVDVYRIDDFSIEAPQTVRIAKRADTVHVKPQISCTVSKPYDFAEMTGKMAVRSVNVKLSGEKVPAKNYRIKHYVKDDIKIYRAKLAGKPKIHSLLKNAQALPIEFQNVLKYIKKRPNMTAGESILACYGPIVEGSVLKLVLNKQRGTLLVWYKSGSRQLRAKYLYLIRRLGLSGKPEWRWE